MHPISALRLSPRPAEKEYEKKRMKYQNAGVREYWIVDPKTESVLCYFFEESGKPHSYTFDDKIPVRIYDNNLVINFAEIKERLV